MTEIILIVLSFLIGIFCINFIRSYDRYEKEPISIMQKVTVRGGLISIILSLILYSLLEILGFKNINNTLGALLIVGPVEEFAKIYTLYRLLPIFEKELNEPIDGIIYMSCVALGFSLFENFMYALQFHSNILLFIRLLFATPMHLCFSAFMGLSLYLWTRNKENKNFLIISFMFASIAHGTYDLILFNGLGFIILVIVMYLVYSFTMDILGYASALSPFHLTLENFVNSYQNPTLEKGLECIYCGSKNDKLSYKFNNAFFQKCDGCDFYVTTKSSLLNMFQYFSSNYKKLPKEFTIMNSDGTSTIYQNNIISESKGLAYFDLKAFSNTLEQINNSLINKIKSRWWFPKKIYL